MILCVCKGISERQVRTALEAGARSFEELSRAIDGAGSVCGICQGVLRSMLDAGVPAVQMNKRGGCHAKGKQEGP